MEPTPSKSPFQFSLRKLLVLTLIAACLLGISRLFPSEMFVWAIAVEVLAIALFINIAVITALERSRKRRITSSTADVQGTDRNDAKEP